MPTYEYECQKCKAKLEVVQSMKDAPLRICPKERCRRRSWGKGRMKRLLSAGAGLIFKGSGFYITDYRSEGYKQAAKKETDAAAPKSTPAKEATSTKAAPATKETPTKKTAKTESA